MKKFNLLIIILLSSLLICCKTKNNNNENTDSLMDSVQGIYTNDTIALDFKNNGTCEIITADTILNGDFVWDVDSTNILIVDQNQNIMILKALSSDTLKSNTNSIYYKKNN